MVAPWKKVTDTQNERVSEIIGVGESWHARWPEDHCVGISKYRRMR
jgi:hypothetical protein